MNLQKANLSLDASALAVSDREDFPFPVQYVW